MQEIKGVVAGYFAGLSCRWIGGLYSHALAARLQSPYTVIGFMNQTRCWRTRAGLKVASQPLYGIIGYYDTSAFGHVDMLLASVPRSPETCRVGRVSYKYCRQYFPQIHNGFGNVYVPHRPLLQSLMIHIAHRRFRYILSFRPKPACDRTSPGSFGPLEPHKAPNQSRRFPEHSFQERASIARCHRNLK